MDRRYEQEGYEGVQEGAVAEEAVDLLGDTPELDECCQVSCPQGGGDAYLHRRWRLVLLVYLRWPGHYTGWVLSKGKGTKTV